MIGQKYIIIISVLSLLCFFIAIQKHQITIQKQKNIILQSTVEDAQKTITKQKQLIELANKLSVKQQKISNEHKININSTKELDLLHKKKILENIFHDNQYTLKKKKH